MPAFFGLGEPTGLAKAVGAVFTISWRAEFRSYVDDDEVTFLSLGSSTLVNWLSSGY